MKKLLVTLSLSAACLVNGAVVKQSGNWSDPATWGLSAGTTVPTTQATVEFEQSGMSLVADVDATISSLSIDKAKIKEYSLSAKDGKTLTISAFPNSGVTTNTTLNVGSDTDATLGGTVSVAGTWKNTVFNVDSGLLNFRSTGGATGHYDSTFNIAKDATVTLGSGLNGSNSRFDVYGTLNSDLYTFTVYGNDCSFNLHKGGTFNASDIKFASGSKLNDDGTNTQRIVVDGTVNVTGGQSNYKSRYYALRFGDVSNSDSITAAALKGQLSGIYDIGSNAVITQTSTNKQFLVETTSVLNIANGAKMYLQNGFGLVGYATVNINAQNVFFTHDKNDKDQRNSKFVVTDKNGAMGIAAPTLNINMSNDFGSVEFDLSSNNQYGTTLTINVAEGVNVSFKSLFSNYKDYDDGYGNNSTYIEFVINGLSDKMNFKITDMDDILKDYAPELYFVHFKDSESNALFVTEVNGDYYISASPLVPEPAEWAIIFGIFALGYVIYRRRF